MMELKGAEDGGGDQYREWGWRTFLNFERYLKVPHGYASLRDVSSPRPQHMDRMESFFLAETLKYLYLLQDPKRQVRPDTHIFNTEAHPLSIATTTAAFTAQPTT
jgi:mannosyl-oligosaccharide alpha-1,2-mannosidase